MQRGPVLSIVYSLIREETTERNEDYWLSHIRRVPGAYEVGLDDDPGTGALSDAEINLLDEVYVFTE